MPHPERPDGSPRAHKRELVKVNGQWEVTPHSKQEQFIEWLVDPERAAKNESQNAFAARIGVTPGTLSKWKKEPSFIKQWERALGERNVSPERIGNVMEAAYAKAVAGDVKAMELYMKLIDRMTPDKHLVVTQDVSGLSDEALAALVREGI